jgi:hypothetical protein
MIAGDRHETNAPKQPHFGRVLFPANFDSLAVRFPRGNRPKPFAQCPLARRAGDSANCSRSYDPIWRGLDRKLVSDIFVRIFLP